MDSLKVHVNQAEAVQQWVEDVLAGAGGSARYSTVGLYLVAAVMLQKGGSATLNEHTFLRQSARGQASFRLGRIVYYVEAVPTRTVMERCVEDLEHERLSPVLLVPRSMVERAKGLAAAFPQFERHVTVLVLEDYIATVLLGLILERRMLPEAVLETTIARYSALLGQSRLSLAPGIDLLIQKQRASAASSG